MAFAVELEEWVGAHWHRFITRHASGEFEAARVTLESMRRPLGMLFRALGGAPGVALEATPARRLLLRRTWLQRVAGTCEQAPVSWFNGDSLRLPESLAVYPQAELNRELYRWLALLAASAGPLRHWAQDNQRWARQLLDAYPALRPRYARLVAAHLRQRPSLDDCPAADAELEIALRRALAEPGSVERFPRVERAPWPVPLWLYPDEERLFRWVARHLEAQGVFLFTSHHPFAEDGLGGEDDLVAQALVEMGLAAPERVAALYAEAGLLPMGTRTRGREALRERVERHFRVDSIVSRPAALRVADSAEYQRFHAATFGTYFAPLVPATRLEEFFVRLGRIAERRMQADGQVSEIPVSVWRCRAREGEA